MSERLFEYLANTVFEYFDAQEDLAGTRFSVFMERPADLQSLERSLRKLGESRDFEYQHQSGSEVYTTFELPISNQAVIVAVKKEGVTVDFLTTLRNCVADQSPRQFEGRALLILYGTELDSITKGCKNLGSSHGPLNLQAVLRQLKKGLEDKGTMGHEWERVALNMVLDEFAERISTGSFSLVDFSPVVDCVQNGKITPELVRGLHLFRDPDIEAFDKPGDRLSENLRLFDKVERAMASDVPERRLSKIFTEKGTAELLNAGDDWPKKTYTDVLGLQQKSIKEPDIEYLPGNEHNYCDGLVCWDRPKSGTSAGRRNRHIIVWNHDQRDKVDLKLRFAERPLKSKAKTKSSSGSLSLSVAGKTLSLSLDVGEGVPYFAEVRHQRTVFNIAVFPEAPAGLDEIKTCYQVACKQRRLDVALENSIQLSTSGIEGEPLEEHELVLTPGLRIPLEKPGRVYLNADSDGSADFVDAVLARPTEVIALRFKPEVEPVTPISGQNISQQKRQRGEDCKLSVEDGDVLKVRIGSEEYGLRHENRVLYPLEQQMTSSDAIAWRMSSPDSVVPVDLRLPAAIETAFRDIVSIFNRRETIPSLAYFDEEVCDAVSALCSEIQDFCKSLPEHSQISTEAENIVQIGSIIDHDSNRILLTPLSPINLAYEAALTKRVGGDSTSGEILKLLGQSTLLPFLQWPTWGGDKVFAARTIPEAPQWLEYRPKTDEAHTFGSRVSQTVASKLDQFTRHFRFLFDADNGAPLVIYLINLGDCIEVVKGIAQFYHSQIQSQQDRRGRENDFWIDDLVPIHVHIFGRTESVTQFDRLTHAAWNDELFELIGDNTGGDRDRDEIIEALLRKVHFFYRRDKEFDEISQSGARAHIAFMQTGGVASEYFAGAKFSYNQKVTSYTGVSLGGLNADLPSYMYGNLYRSGFGTKGLTAQYRNELVLCQC